jgi:glycosyltransferase involved in cell wall biosynthesis
MTRPDISVIMTFKSIGRLAEPTLQAVKSAISFATNKGLAVEVIFILDQPDEETESVCKSHSDEISKLIKVDFGSVALTRNFASEKAEGSFLAHLDSDDLFSENWLYDSFKLSLDEGQQSIFHPETIIHFDGNQLLVKAIESDDMDFLAEHMWPGTLWNAHTCARREIYLEHQFPHFDRESGFGYEDWHWTCATLAAGVKHKVVPDTLYCYRVKTWKNSLYSDLANSDSILGRSNLYNLAYQGIS